ncbi:S1C family serine protease [Quadrisphaera sp. DSM 44207]|uniref:S1C family serine protease n=1 Tax=Quadrisphaera sp. DSM 44207 TaxID=1881057 RepID=UPI00088236C3|nr:trypsin-like peptidase domain-containing protein [Quadrisphaera sp. DSM 44207]SDQ07384.1 serine protease, S1-C subfamily, contains C-terminal PDZ domain [Quadrisphaera sp. DSM 44207]
MPTTLPRTPAAALAAGLLTAALVTGCTGTGIPGTDSGDEAASEAAASADDATPGGGTTGGTTGSAAGGTTGSSGSGSGGTGTGGLEDVPGVAQELAPSVVTILTGGGTGSGVIYAEDGLVVTNEHVVRGSTDVEVAFADGQRAPGRVTATDAITDLALVQTDRTDLPAATFQEELPGIGTLAVVIGSPLGFQNSVTAGVVSGLHREIPGSATQGQQSLVDLVQTDAAISPGNSGGAVSNAEGEVIGISEAYIPPQAGAVALGFAIPAATAVDVVEQLLEDGRAEHAFAGIAPAALTPEIAQQFGLEATEGSLVRGVVPDGPAEQAGLRAGDVITAVDDEPIATPEDFLAALRSRDPGDAVTLTVRSPGGEPREVELELTDRPER